MQDVKTFGSMQHSGRQHAAPQTNACRTRIISGSPSLLTTQPKHTDRGSCSWCKVTGKDGIISRSPALLTTQPKHTGTGRCSWCKVTGKDGTASGRCMYLSHTQHGVQVVEGPGLVGRGGDEVLVGWVQRHTHHLCRVVCQHSLQSAAATSNT